MHTQSVIYLKSVLRNRNPHNFGEAGAATRYTVVYSSTVLSLTAPEFKKHCTELFLLTLESLHVTTASSLWHNLDFLPFRVPIFGKQLNKAVPRFSFIFVNVCIVYHMKMHRHFPLLLAKIKKWKKSARHFAISEHLSCKEQGGWNQTG
jgi:hypothetical protein